MSSKFSPDHYTQGIECWDYIASQNLGFLEGNVIKYVTRAGKKSSETRLDDLLKAQTYIRKLVSIEVTNASESSEASTGVPSGNEPDYGNLLDIYLRDPEAFDN